jgi:hypothetical protein
MNDKDYAATPAAPIRLPNTCKQKENFLYHPGEGRVNGNAYII